MKKIVSIISALTLGVCAFAKTAAELESEFNALKPEAYTTYTAFVAANKADVKAAFDAWKTTAEATSGSLPWENVRKRMFQTFVTKNGADVSAEPIVLITVEAWNIKEITDATNQNFYEETKAANFVVGGVTLSQGQAAWLARRYNDKEYIKTLPLAFVKTAIASDKYFADFYLSAMIPDWLAATDLAAAKAAVTEIESAMLTGNASSELLTRVEKISRALSRRIIDAKLTK